MFFTSSAWSFTFFCCGRRIRKYMITKISANGSSDINMLLVSPPAAAWANAGVISIRTILVKRGGTGAACASGRLGQIRADYSDHRPNCNAAQPLIWAACGLPQGPIWVRHQEPQDVKKAPKNRCSRRPQRWPAEIGEARDKTPARPANTGYGRADRA